MAIYTGSNGNDDFVGTGSNDVFVPMLGTDTVTGGGGSDALLIDYSGRNGFANFSFGAGAGTSALYEFGYGDTAALTFSGIRTIVAVLSAGDDIAAIDAFSAAAGSVTVDGGAGYDELVLDFATLPGTTLAVDALGNLPAIYGQYANFERITISLGAGTNAVTMGAEDNRFVSHGGIDTIDGGGGQDQWEGRFEAATADLTFTANGSTGQASLSNGTTLTRISSGEVHSGSGNDAFNLTNAAFGVAGGAGNDTLTVRDADTNHTTGEGGAFVSIDFAGGAATGDVAGSWFNGIENLDLVLGDEDDTVSVGSDAAFGPGSLKLDGGLGINSLELASQAMGDVTFVEAANGAITSNLGTFAHFDTVLLSMQGGTHTITTQGGNDQIRIDGVATATVSTGDGNDFVVTRGGKAQINLGSGIDSWDAVLTGTPAQVIAINAGAQVIADSRIDGVEAVNLHNSTAGSTFIVGNGMTHAQIEGSGSDVFRASFAGTAGAAADTGYIYITQNELSGAVQGMSAASDIVSFNQMDKVDIVLNDADNTFRIYGGGVSQDPHRVKLDGGLGNDTVTVFGDAAGFAVVQNGIGGYVVVDTDASDGFLPEFTVTSFEHVHFAGATTDTVIDLPAYGGGVTTTGSLGNDTITGTVYADVLNGLAGNDSLFGLGGDDVLNGGAGNDRIDGGAGLDTVTYADAAAAVRVNLSLAAAQNSGGSGLDTITGVENLTGSLFADTLTGDAQANVLIGLDGNDRLDGGAGVDTLVGGLGNDTYVVDNSADVVVERPGEGTDTVNASASFVLSADVERLVLTGTGAINGTGNALGNTLTGNGGANGLYGLDGADVINGGGGNDLIAGGRGADNLTGGAGSDTFVFDVMETTANFDVVRDFTHGTDKIALDHTVFTALSALGAYPGALAAGDFVIGKAATTASQHLIYNAVNGALFYDADGVGGAAQIEIAMLHGRPPVSIGDFIVI